MGNLRLLYSKFGTRKLIDGTHSSIKTKPLKISKLANIVRVMDIHQPFPRSINLVKNIPKWDLPEFLEAEEMGIQYPRWCNWCSNCAHCSISSQNFTRKEQAKLQLMEQNIWLDTESKRMVVKNPVVKDPSVLSDKMVSSPEKMLKRDNILDQYKVFMQEFIDRPRVREIP